MNLKLFYRIINYLTLAAIVLMIYLSDTDDYWKLIKSHWHIFLSGSLVLILAESAADRLYTSLTMLSLFVVGLAIYITSDYQNYYAMFVVGCLNVVILKWQDKTFWKYFAQYQVALLIATQLILVSIINSVFVEDEMKKFGEFGSIKVALTFALSSIIFFVPSSMAFAWRKTNTGLDDIMHRLVDMLGSGVMWVVSAVALMLFFYSFSDTYSRLFNMEYLWHGRIGCVLFLLFLGYGRLADPLKDRIKDKVDDVIDNDVDAEDIAL